MIISIMVSTGRTVFTVTAEGQGKRGFSLYLRRNVTV